MAQTMGNTNLNTKKNKRSGNDRRKRPGFNIRLLLGAGKRGLIRRQKDRSKFFFVDRYSPKLFVAIVTILFLCVVDALLTLFLIDNGAYETNPIMAYYLKLGPHAFFAVKYAVTIVGTIVLLIFRNIVIWKINIKTQSLIYLFAGIYLAVVVWELYLVIAVII